jgi:hypothetical protein
VAEAPIGEHRPDRLDTFGEVFVQEENAVLHGAVGIFT